MFKENMNVFIKIKNMINEQTFPLILSGSTSLYLQGVDIEVNDVDIVTDYNGAKYLNEILEEYCIKEMEYSVTEKYKSYFGIYNIDGVKVDVTGEFQYKLKNGEWSKPNHTNEIRYCKYNDVNIQVLKLEQELIEYESVEKINTIIKIKEKIGK